MAKRLKPVQPGEILREEFMVPLGLSMNKSPWLCVFP
jgi:plasmid maintenance system antidote protein VapI